MLLIVADAVATSFAWRINFFLRFESGWFPNAIPADMVAMKEPLIFLVVFWWAVMTLASMYKTPISLSWFDEIVRSSKAVFWGVLVLFLMTFDRDAPVSTSRFFLLTYAAFSFGIIVIFRTAIRTLQRWLRNRGYGLWEAVIVGCSDQGKKLYNQLFYDPVWGFKILGFIDNNRPENEDEKYPFIGSVDDLPDLIQSRRVDWVIVAPKNQSEGDLLEVFDRCAQYRVRLMIVASYYEMVMGLVRSVEIHGMPLVEVAAQHVSLIMQVVKRVLDIIASIIWMAFLTVLTPIIATAIKLNSRGPIFYRQTRVGRNGKEFTLYKFRSMVQDAEKKSGAVWAKKDDPRITKVGRLLRKTHLDEIPQFYNVLKGDMSLVGPRPERKKFVDEFTKLIPLYQRRMCIRPGLTGWAQVRHKYDETLDDVREKTGYDLFYINHISIALDLRIILLTFNKVFRGEGQ